MLQLGLRMVIDLSDEQSLNAARPIVSTVAGIVILESEVQPLNACGEIVATDEGMLTEVRFTAPRNAYLPIVVAPSPIETLVISVT